MRTVSVAEKAGEISSGLGEPGFVLAKRLEAAEALSAAGTATVQDFDAANGKAELSAKKKGAVKVLPVEKAVAESWFESMMRMPLSGREPKEYLLSLALFCSGTAVFFREGGKGEVSLAADGRPAPYSADFFIFGKNSEGSLFYKSAFSAEAGVSKTVLLGENSAAACCFVQANESGADGNAAVLARLAEGANLRMLSSNLGGNEQSDQVTVLQEGRGGRCESYEASLSDGHQRRRKESGHFHLAPDTYSRSIFKYATAGESQVRVDANVTIDRAAPGSDTHLLAKSLLLSDQAVSHVIPQLFVHNSDVAAGHGSALTPLSEEELFYLASRGIGENEGRYLVLQGFLQELLVKSGLGAAVLKPLAAEIDLAARRVFPSD